MKRRMIVCITLAAILLVVWATYWAFCRLPHLTGSTIKNVDSYLLDAQYMNGTDGHTMMLNAGDVLSIHFETEKGALHLDIQARWERSIFWKRTKRKGFYREYC